MESLHILPAVKRSLAEIQCSQTVKSLFVMWSSGQAEKNDGKNFLTPAGRSSDYGVKGSVTASYPTH